MKWYKGLLLLTCCLRFLTHSGNENLYQSHLYLGGANMNHQTIYWGTCHYHGSRIQESSSQKAGSSKSWQTCSHSWTCSHFPWQLLREDQYPCMSLDPILLGYQLQGFLLIPQACNLCNIFKGSCPNRNAINDSATPAITKKYFGLLVISGNLPEYVLVNHSLSSH